MTDAATAAELLDEKTITLRAPITFAGQTYATMTLREPTAGLMMEWDRFPPGSSASIQAIALVSGLPSPAVKEMGARDFIKASAFIDAFAMLPPITPGEAFPDELVITLRRPIELGDNPITEIRLREPKAKDLIEWETANGVAADCAIIAAVAGLSDVAVRQLRARDLVQGAAYLANFLAPAPSAGDRS